MDYHVPAGWRLLKVGEIVYPDDRYWHENKGPWTTFSDGEDVAESIGQPLTEEMYPVITAEF